MQVRYGPTWSAPANGVRVTSQRTIVRGEDGVPYEFIDRVECDGYLEANGQAALTAQENAMKRALAVPFGDLVFAQDDGSNSATVLLNATSLTGVVVTDGPHFPDSTGPEYVSQRHFRFTAEADYAFAGVSALRLIDWSETIDVQGGGPKYVVKAAIEGPPQRQKVYDLTPCSATQTGWAVGYGDYPAIAPPIWPFALTGSPSVKRSHPKKRGRRKYTHFRIDWSYTYEWVGPLTGVPTRWV